MKRLAVLLLLVVACGTPADRAPADGGEWQRFAIGTNEVWLVEITLDSGRQCVVTYSGGLSCDWGER